jgi:hypothetical protein
MEGVAVVLFGLALVHSFSTKLFESWAGRNPRHAGLLHLLGEVEIVFGFWAFALVVAMAFVKGPDAAIGYAESRKYTEPLFVFVVMVVAASRPVLEVIRQIVLGLARLIPVPMSITQTWLGLAVIPLFGSVVTEPAAMTLAALTLAPSVFRRDVPERVKYAALGVLFVNVSIGGTLTTYAAPPVLMVADVWGWTTPFMASTFGWKAALAVVVNATAVTLVLRRHLSDVAVPALSPRPPVPIAVSSIHLAFLGSIIAFAHHPVIFLWMFLFFLGFVQAYEQHQSRLILKESLLVGFFLAGLVVLGGMQEWWLAPIVSSLPSLALFFGALGLTAVTDNAALTYLGSLTTDISDSAKYMLVAGAVAGGGLTIIANAPNPAGVALLRSGFDDESVGAGGLLLGALPPTAVAAAAFML